MDAETQKELKQLHDDEAELKTLIDQMDTEE